jgi:hypothetical protein
VRRSSGDVNGDKGGQGRMPRVSIIAPPFLQGPPTSFIIPTMMAPAISVPEDIAILIVESLELAIDYTTPPVLKKCCLLSRAFVFPCQKLLYSRIYLPSYNGCRHFLARYYKHMLRYPHLAQHVRIIELTEVQTFRNVAILPGFLSLFPRVQSCSISAFHWRKLDRKLQNSITTLVHQPSVTAVEIYDAIAPDTLLIDTGNLKELRIVKSLITDFDDDIPESKSKLLLRQWWRNIADKMSLVWEPTKRRFCGRNLQVSSTTATQGTPDKTELKTLMLQRPLPASPAIDIKGLEDLSLVDPSQDDLVLLTALLEIENPPLRRVHWRHSGTSFQYDQCNALLLFSLAPQLH